MWLPTKRLSLCVPRREQLRSARMYHPTVVICLCSSAFVRTTQWTVRTSSSFLPNELNETFRDLAQLRQNCYDRVSRLSGVSSVTEFMNTEIRERPLSLKITWHYSRSLPLAAENYMTLQITNRCKSYKPTAALPITKRYSSVNDHWSYDITLSIVNYWKLVDVTDYWFLRINSKMRKYTRCA